MSLNPVRSKERFVGFSKSKMLLLRVCPTPVSIRTYIYIKKAVQRLPEHATADQCYMDNEIIKFKVIDKNKTLWQRGGSVGRAPDSRSKYPRF